MAAHAGGNGGLEESRAVQSLRKEIDRWYEKLDNNEGTDEERAVWRAQIAVFKAQIPVTKLEEKKEERRGEWTPEDEAELADAKAELADAKAELAEEELKTADGDKDDIKERRDRHREEARGHRKRAEDIRAGTRSAQQPTGAPASPASSSSAERRKGAWSVDYESTNDLVPAFSAHVDECVGRKCFGPFIPICQSSCWGKSRMLEQYARTRSDVRVVYLSCSDSSVPRRDIEGYEYLRSCLPPPNVDPQGRKRWEEMMKVFYEHVWQYGQTTHDFCNTDGVWGDIRQSLGNPDAGLGPVHFILDEAHEFSYKVWVLDSEGEKYETTPLRIMRRALSSYNQHDTLRVAVIVASTTSSILDLAPLPTAESFRGADGPFINSAAEPFFAFPMNVFTDTTLGYARFGRPVWGARAKAEVAQSIPEFAMQKLTKEEKVTTSSPHAALAAVACRVPLKLQPAMSDLDKLVSRHMATLIHVDMKERCGKLTFPFEPALASGGAAFMDRFFKDCIEEVAVAVSSDLASTGDLGELATALIILRANDLATKAVNEGKGRDAFVPVDVPVHVLMSTLFGVDEVEELKPAYEHVKGATVRFNGLVKLRHHATVGDLEWGYEHFTAFFCKDNAFAYDIMIPIKISDDNFGVIAVQVKNHSGWCNLVGAGEKLVLCDSPYVGIFMEVGKKERSGSHEEDRKVVLHSNHPTRQQPRRAGKANRASHEYDHIVAQGFAYPFLTDDERRALRSLVNTEQTTHPFVSEIGRAGGALLYSVMDAACAEAEKKRKKEKTRKEEEEKKKKEVEEDRGKGEKRRAEGVETKKEGTKRKKRKKS